eukprot:COSAG01_NODE_33604_length_561_cov_1.655844_1_plen_81_part_01
MRKRKALVDEVLVHECVVKQNEAIYFPSEWYHATMSLADSVTVTASCEVEWLGTGNTSRRAKGGAAYALAQVTDAAVREKW